MDGAEGAAEPEPEDAEPEDAAGPADDELPDDPDDEPEAVPDDPDDEPESEVGAALGPCSPSWPAPAGAGSWEVVVVPDEVEPLDADAEPPEPVEWPLAPRVRPGATADTTAATTAVAAAVAAIIQRLAREMRVSAASRAS